MCILVFILTHSSAEITSFAKNMWFEIQIVRTLKAFVVKINQQVTNMVSLWEIGPVEACCEEPSPRLRCFVIGPYALRSCAASSSLQCITYTEVSDTQTVVDRPAPQL